MVRALNLGSGRIYHYCPSRMNCVSLDSIGIAGFGHDFGALHGKRSTVEEVFDSFGTAPPMSMIILLLGQVIPILQKLPSTRVDMMKKLQDIMGEVSEQLLERSRKEKASGGGATDTSRSIIGSLRMSVFFILCMRSRAGSSR